MRSRNWLGSLLVVLVTASRLFAADPQPTGHVTDLADKLSPQTRQQLEARLTAYQQQTTNEVAVLITPSLGGEEIEPYATRIFHAWGVGQKGQNNGVLLVWAPVERKVRIEVGYGLEPVLTDSTAGGIIRNAIIPMLRVDRSNAAMLAGVDAILSTLTQKASRAPEPIRPPDAPMPWWLIGALMSGVLAIVIGVWWWVEQAHEREMAENAERSRQLFAEMDASERRVREREAAGERFAKVMSMERRTLPQPPAKKAAEPTRRREDDSPSYTHSYSSPAPSYSPPSSDYGSSSSFGGFSGGDSGGGGASGSY